MCSKLHENRNEEVRRGLTGHKKLLVKNVVAAIAAAVNLQVRWANITAAARSYPLGEVETLSYTLQRSVDLSVPLLLIIDDSVDEILLGDRYASRGEHNVAAEVDEMEHRVVKSRNAAVIESTVGLEGRVGSLKENAVRAGEDKQRSDKEDLHRHLVIGLLASKLVNGLA